MLPMLFMIFLFDVTYCSEQLHLLVSEDTKPVIQLGNLQLMIKNQTKNWKTLKFKEFKDVSVNKNNFEIRSLIKIDEKEGNISLQMPIDREEVCQALKNCMETTIDYYITVDERLFNLKMYIMDVNDNLPSFNPDAKLIEFPEDTGNFTNISLPVAKDLDSDKYGIKNYVLKPISNNQDYLKYFKLFVNPNTKRPYLTVIRILDRETIDRFEFILVAIDGGKKEGECKITLKINDVNDNTPQWEDLPYTRKMRECDQDTKVMQLKASDRDDGLTEGGKITYKISDNTAHSELINRNFYISDKTLNLHSTSLRSLSQSNWSIPVLAIDGGGRSNETTVELEIIDCNDHSPTITVDTPMPSISENFPNVTTLTSITVRDEDFGINSEFHCKINDSNHVTLTESLIIDKQFKVFKLQTRMHSSFDREINSRHSIEMTCHDNGIPTMSSLVIITICITDQNDNAPKFESKSTSFSVSEDTNMGSEIGQVIATDADINPNNVITYSIVCDEKCQNTFSITNHGVIQLLQRIDRETIDNYQFTVLAIDSDKPFLNDSCEIKVLVMDVNDCAPEIEKEHNYRVLETVGSFSVYLDLGKLNATDQDYGPNGSLKFRLVQKHSNFHRIHVSSDGHISIRGIIDREKNDRIVAEVVVFDGGPVSLTSTTTLVIDILDINDNKPKFVLSRGNIVNVSLDLPLSSIIYHLNATDPDKDNNGTIDFSLLGDETVKTMFAVHPNGQITLVEKLKSKNRIDKLTIEAKDRGIPPLSEETTLYIRYFPSKIDKFNSKQNELTMNRKEKSGGSNNYKVGYIGAPNVMLLIYLLAAIVLIIVVGIGVVFVYLWCRGDSDKHVAKRELSSNSNIHKNITKSDKSQMLKLNAEVNNQLLRTRNSSYQIVESPQLVNYSSLTKNFVSPESEDSYQFQRLMLTGGADGGNYSAFHARSMSPLNDKSQNDDRSPFIKDPNTLWDHRCSQPMNTLIHSDRNRNLSTTDSVDMVYDNHKYSVAITPNFEKSARRNADIIQLKNDLTYKTKVNYVASSFV